MTGEEIRELCRTQLATQIAWAEYEKAQEIATQARIDAAVAEEHAMHDAAKERAAHLEEERAMHRDTMRSLEEARRQDATLRRYVANVQRQCSEHSAEVTRLREVIATAAEQRIAVNAEVVRLKEEVKGAAEACVTITARACEVEEQLNAKVVRLRAIATQARTERVAHLATKQALARVRRQRDALEEEIEGASDIVRLKKALRLRDRDLTLAREDRDRAHVRVSELTNSWREERIARLKARKRLTEARAEVVRLDKQRNVEASRDDLLELSKQQAARWRDVAAIVRRARGSDLSASAVIDVIRDASISIYPEIEAAAQNWRALVDLVHEVDPRHVSTDGVRMADDDVLDIISRVLRRHANNTAPVPPKWREITNETPADREHVLLLWPGKVDHIQTAHRDEQYRPAINGRVRWLDIDGDEIERDAPTHWAPNPAPLETQETAAPLETPSVPLTRRRTTVYIAGPYRATDVRSVRCNVARASALGRYAAFQGLTPVVPHLQGWHGLYGPHVPAEGDSDETALECGLAQAVITDRVWAIAHDDGTLSEGTRAEIEARYAVDASWWRGTAGGVRLTWAQWVRDATAHGFDLESAAAAHVRQL